MPKNLDEKGRFNLQMWLDNEPHVAIAYKLKESFYDIYDAPTKEEAGKMLDAWRASVPGNMKKGKKSFGPLLTATRNWRVEMLAYFDHPISNGYTEALNGVAKVINRQGRGYSFDVLRARLLFKNKTPALVAASALSMNRTTAQTEAHATLIEAIGRRCESCGGVFEPCELEAHHIAPLVDNERPRRLYVCANCHRRFHTERANAHNSASTP